MQTGRAGFHVSRYIGHITHVLAAPIRAANKGAQIVYNLLRLRLWVLAIKTLQQTRRGKFARQYVLYFLFPAAPMIGRFCFLLCVHSFTAFLVYWFNSVYSANKRIIMGLRVRCLRIAFKASRRPQERLSRRPCVYIPCLAFDCPLRPRRCVGVQEATGTSQDTQHARGEPGSCGRVSRPALCPFTLGAGQLRALGAVWPGRSAGGSNAVPTSGIRRELRTVQHGRRSAALYQRPTWGS